MKKRTILTCLVVVIITATLAFIFSNSLESVSESSEKSENVMGIITPALELFVGKGNVTDHLVRKIAHFIEFATLGCELAVLCVLRWHINLQSYINCLFIGLAFAVTDEALQLISNRGSQVQDILLDFVAATAGVSVVTIVCLIFISITRKKIH